MIKKKGRFEFHPEVHFSLFCAGKFSLLVLVYVIFFRGKTFDIPYFDQDCLISLGSPMFSLLWLKADTTILLEGVNTFNAKLELIEKKLFFT